MNLIVSTKVSREKNFQSFIIQQMLLQLWDLILIFNQFLRQ